MITMQSNRKEDLPGELAETVEEYRRTLYWVTDRTNMLNMGLDELGWGNIVLFVALRGKIDLLTKLIQGSYPPLDEEVVTHYESIVSDWLEYIGYFRSEVEG